MLPLIGITTGEIHNVAEPWSPVAYGQSHTYVDVIIGAGGVPVLIPILQDESALRQLYDLLDGLFLAGGNDLEPKLYGQEPSHHTTDYSARRDSSEVLLATWALADKKPILGICRGMQLVNALQGGTLYQHIPAELPDAEDHDSSTKAKDLEHFAHTLHIDPASRLCAILQADHIRTNTHHQAIKDLGKGVKATAWAADGIIEAVEMTDYPYMIGVESHPESLTRAEPGWKHLFESFVAASMPK